MTDDAMAARVAGFLASYVAAFERYDPDAIADHFAYPVQVTGDADEVTPVTVPAKDAWVVRLGELLGAYRSLGVATARVLDLSTTGLSPRLVVADVDWSLDDRAGATIYTFDSVYTLAQVGDGLRIVAIAHNETPRLRAAIGRLRGA